MPAHEFAPASPKVCAIKGPRHQRLAARRFDDDIFASPLLHPRNNAGKFPISRCVIASAG
jgi:hypothetical protein